MPWVVWSVALTSVASNQRDSILFLSDSLSMLKAV